MQTVLNTTVTMNLWQAARDATEEEGKKEEEEGDGEKEEGVGEKE